MNKKQILIIVVIIAAFVASLFIEHAYTEYKSNKSKQFEKQYLAELNNALHHYEYYEHMIYDI